DGDSWVTQFATDSYIQELLESGVEVNHYCKGMVHAKTMVVDDELSMIGTSNMDYRSFEINFEITAMIYSEEIAEEMFTIFQKDIEECETVDLEKWAKRPMLKKWKESFCRLWAPLL